MIVNVYKSNVRIIMHRIGWLVLINLFIYSPFTAIGQNIVVEESEIEFQYAEYVKSPREAVFVHLNKQVILQKEALAFTAYVFDKKTKLPSISAVSLYVEILNDKGERVEAKMLKLNNGSTTNQFDIDDKYGSGTYTIRAYTNWMKNFSENNHFQQGFRIITVDEKFSASQNILDAQLLPEGGHLLADVINTVGVVIKDSNGYGLEQATGVILEDQVEVASFTTNHLGIGMFKIRPNSFSNYTALIKTDNGMQTANFPKVQSNGVALSVSSLQSDVFIELNTNEKTFQKLKNSEFKVLIHNGSVSTLINVQLLKPKTILKLKRDDLTEGIHVVTVFNNENQPILERLFYEHKKISKLSMETSLIQKVEDSVRFSFKFDTSINDKLDFNNFSVSILPQETKSYKENICIYSQLYLRPYLNGAIQNAPYYFKDVNRRKKLDLDILLLTQGWSAYNWETIFGDSLEITHPYELGVTAQVKVNKKSHDKFMIYDLHYSNMGIIDLVKGESEFTITGLYPMEDESFEISYIDSFGITKQTSVNPTFTPSTIPPYTNFYNSLLPLDIVKNQVFETFYKESEMLDTVLIQGSDTRREEIQLKTRGTVDFFDDAKRNATQLISYFNSKGYSISNYDGQLALGDNRRSSNGPPIIVIDDVVYRDVSLLQNFTFQSVDYIEIFRNGIGAQSYRQPDRGDVIKIYTDPKLSAVFSKKTSSRFKFPLSYSSPKKFYTPQYSVLNSTFYNRYGVIDWKGALSMNKDGALEFTTPYKGTTSFKVIIEGVTSDGKLIHEVVDLNL